MVKEIEKYIEWVRKTADKAKATSKPVYQQIYS